MANYAAVLSLIHTLNNIKNHPKPPISLHQSHLDSLTLNLTFFQHFLESYPTQEDHDLEGRIAAAAYAAEDVIETHIVHQIHQARCTSGHARNISSVDLYGDLERVIQDMDLIKTEVMDIIQHKKIMTLTPHLSSGGPSSSTWQSSTKPEFDDARVNQVLDKLTGQQSGLRIIPIVGMGGIGKTTFASAIYSHPLIVQHFDIMAWVTISQEYSRANALKLLCQQIKGGVDDMSSEDKMGLILYQHLCGRRYLIVMDDVWSVEALDEVKSFFPDNNDGSRIMITTRLSNLNFMFSGFPDIQMQVLDEDKSWNLLCKTVFGELDCPVELKHIGKEIAKNCRGLPLSIAVIGGLLIKSTGARPHWEYILQNLSSLINLEADEYCQQLLLRSYKELPIHLKPCFLYMGVFPEDSKIYVSHVIKLWISEGILKLNDDKSLEDVAAEYLNELIDRNLILVHKLRLNREAKICKIHDLLRDVCVREAEKQKFLCVLRQQKHQSPQDTHVECRICVFHEDPKEKYSPEFLHAVESASLTRSILTSVHGHRSRVPFVGNESPSPRFPLLRVLSSAKRRKVLTPSNNDIFEQANLRYVYLNLTSYFSRSRLSSLCSLLWNVQTLNVESKYYYDTFDASKIWGMPLLRHVMLTKCVLPDPLDGEDKFVLDNLHTLSCIENFVFSEEVVKRIPNVKKLKVEYKRIRYNEDEGLPNFCLNNLGRLRKLESFSLEVAFTDSCDREYIQKNLVCFPHSLKKLSLTSQTRLNWEDLNMRVGTLPLLQLLRLGRNACVGPTWETVEGKFCSLRVLIISCCDDLKYWDTDNTHFPCLERLSLYFLNNLEEIPLSIGDISPLKFIQVIWCSKSAFDSAERIKQEQLEYGNEDLQFEIVAFPFAVGDEAADFEEDEEDNQTD